MNKMDLRKKVLSLFSEHCIKCDGLCCNHEAEFTVFDRELKNLSASKNELTFKNQWGSNGKSKDIKITRVAIKGKCPFVGKNGCGLKIEHRPLDCMSYPIFPIIKYSKTESKEIVGMMVHKSCPFAVEISKDKALIKIMNELWAEELKDIKSKDLRDWFGNKRNYWLDKNIIKI